MLHLARPGGPARARGEAGLAVGCLSQAAAQPVGGAVDGVQGCMDFFQERP